MRPFGKNVQKSQSNDGLLTLTEWWKILCESDRSTDRKVLILKTERHQGLNHCNSDDQWIQKLMTDSVMRREHVNH